MIETSNGRPKLVWTDAAVAEAQLYAGVNRLGGNVSGLEDPLLKRGFSFAQLYKFRDSAREVTPEIAKASINFNLDLIKDEGLNVDYDLIEAGALSVSRSPREASLRTHIVVASALGKLYHGR